MSAIAGLLHVDGRPARPEDVAPLTELQSHRGPDGISSAVDGPAALGHCLLRTTPESLRERQPLGDSESGLLLTADARLDNRDELINILGAPPDSPDPEIILRAYRKWGTSCVEHFTGDFALALWDRNAGHLFCATDHLGVKPLHYAWHAGVRFVCATEDAAILRSGQASDDIDDLRVADFLLAPVSDDPTRTFYSSIRVLAPAHRLVASPAGLRIERYWSLDPDRELTLGSDEEYALAFREKFEHAVACRLRTDGSVGSMLSGGLDSSAVSSMAAHLLSERAGSSLRTYSAVFDTVREADEREYIRSVVDRYGTTPFFLVADDAGPFSRIQSFVDSLAGPLTGGNAFINRTLYRQAGLDGCRVVLSGFDGDTTVSHGVDYLRELRDGGRYLELIREVRAASRLWDKPWLKPAWSWMKGPVYHHFRINALKRQLRRFASNTSGDGSTATLSRPQPWEVPLSEELRSRVHESPPEPRPFRSERDEHHHRLTRSILSQTSRLLDLCAGAGGVETRYPFLDRRLIEFCLSVPPDQKLSRGWTRSILRRGTEGIMPDGIRWRPTKANLQPGFSHSFRTYDGELVMDTLTSPPSELTRFVNQEHTADLLAQFRGGAIDSTAESTLFRIFSLAWWLREI